MVGHEIDKLNGGSNAACGAWKWQNKPTSFLLAECRKRQWQNQG